METFGAPREFVENTRYSQDRKDALAALDLSSIDEPIVDIVAGFNTLPHCFTLQSCYGHFLCASEQNLHSLEPIPCDGRLLIPIYRSDGFVRLPGERFFVSLPDRS